MSREIKTEQEILDWINSEIHEDEDCQEIEMTSLMRTEEAEDGSNWSSGNLQAHGVPAEAYVSKVNEIVGRASKLFNIG